MTTENASLALDLPAAGAAADPGSGVEVEESFFRRGVEEDQRAREQLRRKLAEMPRWPRLGWAIGLLAVAVVAAAMLLFVVPPP
jgi:hypothetical protein